MKALFRGSFATLVGSVALFVASTALADGEACYNDIDCPGTACGDAVCNWTKTPAMAVGMKTFACNPAGSQTPVGHDGWCTTDADCKCMGQGAKCQQPTLPYCTFTKPMGGTGGSGAGGSASTGGSTATAGASTAGMTSSGGTTATGGTGSTAGAKDDGGGCSVSVPGGANTGLALGVGLLGLGIVFARRRR